jgi:hypothetical protein
MIVDIALLLIVFVLFWFRNADKKNNSNNSLTNEWYFAVYEEIDKIKSLQSGLLAKLKDQSNLNERNYKFITSINSDTRLNLIGFENEYQENFEKLIDNFNQVSSSIEERILQRLSKISTDVENNSKKLVSHIGLTTQKNIEYEEKLGLIIYEFEQDIGRLQTDHNKKLSEAVFRIERESTILQNKTKDKILNNYKELYGLIDSLSIKTDSRIINLKEFGDRSTVEFQRHLESLNEQIDGSAKETNSQLKELDDSIDGRTKETNSRLKKLDDLINDNANGTDARLKELDKLRNSSVSDTNNQIISLSKLVTSECSKIDKRFRSLKEFADSKHLEIDEKIIDLEKFDRDCFKTNDDNTRNFESISLSIERFAANELVFNKFQRRQNLITKNLESLVNKSNVFNYNTFSGFSRRFVRRDYEDSILPILNLYNLEFSFGSIGYLAHKICKIEEACVGRLATNIQDALIRLITVLGLGKVNCRILEIGTLFGINLCIVEELSAAYGMNIKYQVIDPLDGYYKSGKLDIVTKQKVNSENFWHNIKKTGLNPEKFELIKGFSHHKKIHERIEPNSTDLIFVDGDHTRKGVALDIRNFHKKLRKGGFFIFDDYDSKQWPEVRIAVDSSNIIRKNFEFIGFAFRTAIYKKK